MRLKRNRRCDRSRFGSASCLQWRQTSTDFHASDRKAARRHDEQTPATRHKSDRGRKEKIFSKSSHGRSGGGGGGGGEKFRRLDEECWVVSRRSGALDSLLLEVCSARPFSPEVDTEDSQSSGLAKEAANFFDFSDENVLSIVLSLSFLHIFFETGSSSSSLVSSRR